MKACYPAALLVAAALLGARVQQAHAQAPATPAAASGRSAPPSGAEIASAARAVSLDHAIAAGATMFSRPFRFTPARLVGMLEDGAVIGVLENGAEGDETELPPGKYNLFTARVAGEWRTYAEHGGRVVRQAIRTSVRTTDRSARPTFTTRGWCIIVTMRTAPMKARDDGGYVVHTCF